MSSWDIYFDLQSKKSSVQVFFFFFSSSSSFSSLFYRCDEDGRWTYPSKSLNCVPTTCPSTYDHSNAIWTHYSTVNMGSTAQVISHLFQLFLIFSSSAYLSPFLLYWVSGHFCHSSLWPGRSLGPRSSGHLIHQLHLTRFQLLLLQCLPARCPEPEVDDAIAVVLSTVSTYPGVRFPTTTTITFTCLPGFKLTSKTATATCRSHGNWQPPLDTIKCLPITCPPLVTPPPHAQVRHLLTAITWHLLFNCYSWSETRRSASTIPSRLSAFAVIWSRLEWQRWRWSVKKMPRGHINWMTLKWGYHGNHARLTHLFSPQCVTLKCRFDKIPLNSHVTHLNGTSGSLYDHGEMVKVSCKPVRVS